MLLIVNRLPIAVLDPEAATGSITLVAVRRTVQLPLPGSKAIGCAPEDSLRDLLSGADD